MRLTAVTCLLSGDAGDAGKLTKKEMCAVAFASYGGHTLKELLAKSKLVEELSKLMQARPAVLEACAVPANACAAPAARAAAKRKRRTTSDDEDEDEEGNDEDEELGQRVRGGG
ncbi:hypothetical protein AB1Y20_009934 [Prymnesium parvum]|uniref:Uncharacterized protein n=1 Tax=Prymnesium parvum TaxID=97485 RepID=A0AB34K7Z6_PRYPA